MHYLQYTYYNMYLQTTHPKLETQDKHLQHHLLQTSKFAASVMTSYCTPVISRNLWK